MEYCVGIDLGSTTTKAVVVGIDGSLLGRGITNSRSSYDVACQVALTEALINTRFGMIRQGLGEAGSNADLEALERAFRLAQYCQQLALLKTALQEVREQLGLSTEFIPALNGIV